MTPTPTPTSAPTPDPTRSPSSSASSSSTRYDKEREQEHGYGTAPGMTHGLGRENNEKLESGRRSGLEPEPAGPRGTGDPLAANEGQAVPEAAEPEAALLNNGDDERQAQRNAPRMVTHNDGIERAERGEKGERGDRPDRNGKDGTQPMPPVTRTKTGSSSTRPYSAFPLHTKWLIVGLGGIAAVFSPISSNIFVPAIPTLASAFNTSEESISLGVTIYLVFQAITPSFFGSLSDSYGRRPVYISTLIVYMSANVGLALCPTSAYWLLLVLRALQATGGSAVISIGAGAVSDVAEPRERGLFMSVFQCGAMIGPAFGPLLGGIFAETLGWRSIFWFLTIATGVVLVPLIFFMPETLRSLVGDGSLPPPKICSSPQQLWHRRRAMRALKESGEEKEHVERPPRKKYQPLSAFMILFTPEILMIFVFVSLQYLEFYSILAVYSTALRDVYQLSEIYIGLCYLPAGIGTIIAALTLGRLADYYYRKEEARVGGDYRRKGEEFKIERTRYRVAIQSYVLFLVSCTAFGWCLQAHAPLAATLVVNFFVGLGGGVINMATIYGQDLKPGKGGAVSASLNLVRCIFGAVGTAVIQILYNAIGAGWTFVLLSGLCVVSLPMPLVCLRYASGWRERRAERERVKGDRNQAGESGKAKAKAKAGRDEADGVSKADRAKAAENAKAAPDKAVVGSKTDRYAADGGSGVEQAKAEVMPKVEKMDRTRYGSEGGGRTDLSPGEGPDRRDLNQEEGQEGSRLRSVDGEDEKAEDVP